MPRHHLALIVLVMALWGANFVAIKLGLGEFPPLLFSVLRFTLTAIPVLFFLGHPNIPWKIIISIGVSLGILKFSLLFVGMDIGVPAGIASLFLQTQAFFTVILAALMMRETPGWNDWVGLGIAFVGIGLIAATSAGEQSLYGLVLVVLAGLCWAVSNLIIKKAGNVSMLTLIIYMSLIPPLPLFILSWNIEGPQKIYSALSQISVLGISALLYVVIVGTLFGFAIWGFMLKKYEAAKVAPFSLLVPVFGLAFSYLILGEKISFIQMSGAALVIGGLVFISVKPSRLVSLNKTSETLGS